MGSLEPAEGLTKPVCKVGSLVGCGGRAKYTYFGQVRSRCALRVLGDALPPSKASQGFAIQFFDFFFGQRGLFVEMLQKPASIPG